MNFLVSSEVKATNPDKGITRKVLGFDNQILMAEVYFEKDAIGYQHQHIHSQTSYVVSGKFEVTIGEKTQILHQGDGFFVEPNLIHGAVCLEAGILIDVFSPVREDFIS